MRAHYKHAPRRHEMRILRAGHLHTGAGVHEMRRMQQVIRGFMRALLVVL
jgi:hypothetical protein